ncbi:MAG: glycoside hydrolase family 71/99-like protein [Chthoniobacteraceae bacterium]
MRNWWVRAGVLAVLTAAAGQAEERSAAATSPNPATELSGKVMTGYQGWFRCEGDGSNLGWMHYGGRDFSPGRCTIDLWPDVSEYGSSERFSTKFKFADGRPAELFSSAIPATVHRHFRWMRDYGIDGAFVQRFITSTRDERMRASLDQVLENCQIGAEKAGVLWGLMYDLTGSKADGPARVMADWKRVRAARRIEQDARYIRVGGKLLVALWGLGFNDREPHFDEWLQLIEFLRNDPEVGGCAVMLGVPAYWRTLDRDAVNDSRLHELMARADVVSPWTVGRYTTVEAALEHGERVWKADEEWCHERKLHFLPVIFPGFSWHNLELSRGRAARLNAIPRAGGKFLWSQAVAAKRAGAEMLYVAMFDELDEGTAIFKTTNNPPVGASAFLSESGVASDHYLWLAGTIARMLRGEAPADLEMPIR